MDLNRQGQGLMINVATISLLTILSVITSSLTVGALEYHVSVTGSDSHSGDRLHPFRTIQHAADLAQPGDVITVHAGIYRERVTPPRGGTSDAKRIVYQAARGEKVEVTGSEIVRNWTRVMHDVWKATVPNRLFGEFNPYSDLIHGDWFEPCGREHHTGAVYLNGEWLIEATKLDEVMSPTGQVPAWLGQGGDEYLVNIAWLRAGGARIPASRMVEKQGTQNAPCSEGGECVGFIRRGDWVKYTSLDFGQNASDSEIDIRAASASQGGIIEVHRGTASGEILGVCSVPNTGGWQKWETYHVKLKRASGRTDLCLVFRSCTTEALSAGLWFAQVEADNTTIWAQFRSADPNRQRTEINVRKTVFYPAKLHCDFITVRGFTMAQAATPWAPPTAEQIGLIGTHWSKGWVIENNVICHSVCSGISLGKYGDEWDNRSANSAEGYVETIRRALKNGWNGGEIGHHLVRNNEISYCEQAGIVGSLGAAFSTVSGNTIHDIHIRKLFTGAEMAGIKFHGAIDTVIKGNHIYRTCLGLWLDWMAQGTHVSSNCFHNNGLDLFTEVDHGPLLVDDNLFLSPYSFQSCSRGGAFAHNLFAGSINVFPYDARQTPFHKAHSTELAGFHDNPRGDDRYYNNIFVQSADLSQYNDAKLAVSMAGNLFLKGAKPCTEERDAIVLPGCDPRLGIVSSKGEFSLSIHIDPAWFATVNRTRVTTARLGVATVPQLPFEQADGKPLDLDRDFFGNSRGANPAPGPFEHYGGNGSYEVTGTRDGS